MSSRSTACNKNIRIVKFFTMFNFIWFYLTIYNSYKMTSMDVGPGNCLIDQWIRLNSEKKYDEGGMIAKSGKIKKQ